MFVVVLLCMGSMFAAVQNVRCMVEVVLPRECCICAVWSLNMCRVCDV